MEKLIAVLLFISLSSYAHQGEDHSKHKQEVVETSEAQLQLINESYQKDVFSIFKAKCMDCHGEPRKLPWYHALPFAKQIMNDDMNEAKKHLDIREGFPFKGHGTPKEDLEAIAETIKKNEMPPLRYKVMHWSSGVTENEKKIIQAWVEESLKSLEEENP